MFLLFCGEVFYPRGGLADLKGKFSTFEEAKEAFKAYVEEDFGELDTERFEKLCKTEWYTIAKADTLEIVEEMYEGRVTTK